jgi:O-antigen ligase
VIRAFPVAGTGMNTYGIAMLFHQRHDVGVHYSAAHNDYLQLFADGGLLVGLPACWLVLRAARSITTRFRETTDDDQTRWIRVSAVVGIVSIALQELFDFSLQIPSNAFMVTVLCAIALHEPGGTPVRNPVTHLVHPLGR